MTETMNTTLCKQKNRTLTALPQGRTLLLRMLIFCAISAAFLTACEKTREEADASYQIYYVNKEGTKVLSAPCGEETERTLAAYQAAKADAPDADKETGERTPETGTDRERKEAVVAAFVDELSRMPEKLEYEPPFAGEFSLRRVTLENEQLILDVDAAYRQLDVSKEVLTRAALVRTFTQIDGVDFVAITVEGEALTDSLGNLVGPMNAEMFIENAGNEINAYEKATLKLYFADETGTGLLTANREVVYNSNIPLEKLVVEQLIEGPLLEGYYPAVSSDVKLVNVSLRDRTCYVNFEESFLLQNLNVAPEVTLYAIVNSLTDLSTIDKVQFSVNGETDVLFRESVSLKELFERNLELVAD